MIPTVEVPKHGIGRFLEVKYGAQFVESDAGPLIPAFFLRLGSGVRYGFCDLQQAPHLRFGFKICKPTEAQVERFGAIDIHPTMVGRFGPGDNDWWWIVYSQSVIEPIDEPALAALLARAGQEVDYLDKLLEALSQPDDSKIGWPERLYVMPEAGIA